MGKIDNTQIIGKVLIHFEKLTSTNDYAQNLLSKSKPVEGTVITAAYQSQGRGQIGSVWYSNPGENVILSVILYPDFLYVSQQFQLIKWVSMAVLDTVSSFSPGKVNIKWPNDILLQQKKVAGILIQNLIQGDRIHSSIVGIGLNVNQISFGPELDFATSLRHSGNSRFDLSNVLQTLVQKLDGTYSLFKDNPDSFDKGYLENLYRRGEKHKFLNQAGNVFVGTITGVNKTGQLAVKTETGELQYFSLKEIKFI